tara:strand:+ start:333 stop:617 length:285 start_codon:yes stop_codon:yes gene_type:complete
MARVSTPPKKKTSPPKKKTESSGKTSSKKNTKTKSKSRVNEAGNYTKPELRKRLFNRIKAGSKGGKPGQWSARKAQMLALAYKKAGGGYTTRKA